MAFRTAASGGMIKEKLRSKFRRVCFRQRSFSAGGFTKPQRKTGGT
jgi:hypothetical protein